MVREEVNRDCADLVGEQAGVRQILETSPESGRQTPFRLTQMVTSWRAGPGNPINSVLNGVNPNPLMTCHMC